MEKDKTLFHKLKDYAFDIFESFLNDETTYYAASLSFFTIFSLLPILALSILVVSEIEFFSSYINSFTYYILDFLNPSHSKEVNEFLTDFLSNSNKLGYFGIIYLVIIFALFFKDYDHVVNKLHNTKRRPLYKSFPFYLIFLVSMPIIFTVVVTAQSFYSNDFYNLFISFLFGWGLVFLLFKYSVNREVRSRTALGASFLTTVTLSITKNLFIYYVIYNKTYATIYGSFATLLFFFFWIYVSWVIYLYGIKMCHKLDMELNKKIS